MKVNRETLKIDITTLNKEEAESFIECLTTERERYIDSILTAQILRDVNIAPRVSLYGEGLDKCYPSNRLKAVFWSTSIKRHKQDIKEIDDLIQRVRDMCLLGGN